MSASTTAPPPHGTFSTAALASLLGHDSSLPPFDGLRRLIDAGLALGTIVAGLAGMANHPWSL